jgi:hypothetical protein
MKPNPNDPTVTTPVTEARAGRCRRSHHAHGEAGHHAAGGRERDPRRARGGDEG